MKRLTRQLPNLVTLLNLLSGCLAIILAFSGEMVLASWMIILAAFFDFADGLLARMLNAGSRIGAQLDSLSDVVSFGVAPSVILYLLMAGALSPGEGVVTIVSWVPFTALVVVVAAAYRLARFNSDTEEKYSFRGLPTPATGLFVASLPLTLHRYAEWTGLVAIIENPWVLAGISMALAGLMVSRIPMISLKIKSLKWRDHWPAFVLIGAAPLLVLFFQCLGISMIIILYILLSLLEKPSS